MSIRYDGYILDKNYSFMELNEIMKKFRKIAVNYCEKAILEQTVYQFLYFYHFREIHSDVRIKELIEKAKDINDPLKKLWEYTLEEDWSGLYFQTHLYLAHEIDEFNRFPDIMNAEFDYRCELVFFPTKAGILAMYFGNDKVRYMLESTKYLKKFFYQNSTECPENISEKEWNYRLETWEKALAPDYIPINHGFQVQLFDTKHIMYTKDLSGIDLPSPETMINGLKGTSGNGEASFGVAGEDWERIEITEPPYKYSDARFYAEYYNGFQAPFLVCIWNKDYAELEDLLKNTSEKLYKAYRKEMEWDMTYERLDKNLHSVAKGLGEFYLNGTR